MPNWKAVLLKPNDIMEKAVNLLNSEALGIVIVTDEEGGLLGTVTDGDIRRALLLQKGMDTCLNNIMCKVPIRASIEDSKNDILNTMENKHILQVPIVDNFGRIVNLETLQNLIRKEKYDNPVLLMAGGFGKRLKPLTNHIPKPLLKVGKKPILENILYNLAQAGFQNFFIATNYKAEMIREYFNDGHEWGVNIMYINETKPLGTAGALGLLPKSLPDLPVLVMNGDVLTTMKFRNLLSFHKNMSGVATMCVRKYEFKVPYGVVENDQHFITEINEKPVHSFFINAGIYLIEPPLFEKMNGTIRIDMTDLLRNQIDSGQQVNSFPVHEYWSDIGSVENYERANKEFRKLEL